MDAFPGYDATLKSLQEQFNQSLKWLEEAETGLNEARSAYNKAVGTFPKWILATGLAAPPLALIHTRKQATAANEASRRLKSATARYTAAKDLSNRAKWRVIIYSAIPNALARKVTSADVLLSEFPPDFTLAEEDIKWLEEEFNKAKAELLDPKRHPAIQQMIEPPRPRVVSVDHLTVDEIVKALTTTPMPTLPKEMTTPDELLEFTDYQTPEQMLEIEYRALIQANNERIMWNELAGKALSDIKVGHLSTWDWIKMSVTQPMLATVDLAIKYSEYWSSPIAGFVWSAAMAATRLNPFSPGTTLAPTDLEVEFHRNYNKAREAGANWWMAYGKAFRESDLNWALKLGIEVAFDPVSWIGWGVTTKIVKPLPFVGKYLARANDALIKVTDAPFIAFREIWTKLPKTNMQIVAEQIRQSRRDMFRALSVQTGKSKDSLFKFTADEIRQVGKLAIEAYIKSPDDAILTPGGRFGKWLLLETHITADEFLPVAAKLGVSAAELTDETMLFINRQVYDKLLPIAASSKLTKEEAVTAIITKLGVKNPDAEARKVVSDFLTDRMDAARRSAERILDKESPKAIIEAYEKNVMNVVTRQLESPITMFEYRQTLTSAGIAKIEGFLKSPWVMFIDQQLTRPVATMYLFFLNYGPFNVLESLMRGAFRGLNLVKGMTSDAGAALRMAFGDCDNLPATMIAAREPVGEMWIARSGTADTELIGADVRRPLIERITPPGIFRPLPAVIAKRLPSQLHSLSNLNQWWGELGVRMREYYMLKQSIRILQEQNPELMHAFYSRIRDIRGTKLNGLTKKQVDEIYEAMLYRALRGPGAIREAKQDITSWNRGLAKHQVDEMLAPMTGIDAAYKETIRNRIDEFLADPDKMIAALADSMTDSIIGKRLASLGVYDEIASSMADFVPKSESDMLMLLHILQTSSIDQSGMISSVRRLTTIRGHRLTPEEKDKLHEAVFQRLIQQAERSTRSIDQMATQIKHYADGSQPVVDWDNIVWGKGMTPELQAKVKEIVDDLPVSVKLNIKAFRIDKRIGADRATYASTTGVMQFGSEKAVSKYMIAHEVAHAYISRAVNSGDFEAIDRFYRVISKFRTYPEKPDFVQILADLRQKYPGYRVKVTDVRGRPVYVEADNATLLYNFNPVYKRLDEDFSKTFGSYIEGVETNEELIKFFDDLFPKTVKQVKIKPEYNRAIVELGELWAIKSKHLKQTLSDIRAVHAKYPRIRGKKDWDAINAEVEAIWNRYFSVADPIDSKTMILLHEISGVPAPRFTSPPQELLPVHIAYIFSTTGDGLARGLFKPETHTFMTKSEFINITKARADAVASKFGKTSADIGFTDEAIGKCYDKLIRSIGFDPASVNELTPIMAQLENVRIGLHKINANTKLPPSTVQFLNDWIDEMANNLDNFDMKRLHEAKVKAVEQARKEMVIDFTDYTDANMFDAAMKYIFPFWCVPESTKILTRAGWKHYMELDIGEDVLTVNPDTLMTEWQPILDIAEFDYDGDLMVIPAKGKDIAFTPNHRWLIITPNNGKPQIKRGYELTDGYDLIPRALPHKFPDVSVLDAREAAILGWACTDGYIRRSAGRKPELFIYQHRNKYIPEIELVTGTTAYSRSPADPDNMVVRVAQADTDKLLALCPDWSYLPFVVSRLSEEAATAMWEAMLMAEGSTSYAYNNTPATIFIQKPGVVSETFQLLSVLLGKAITVSSNNELDRTYLTVNRKPYQAKQCRRMTYKHYTGKVWCPVTPNGTWFANFNGNILPTGNTYESQRWQWVPRQFIQKPGVPLFLGRYMDYTDGGYIPIPGLDIEFNPFRGSVFMGGFRRLFMKDYPEYHDAVPGSEVLDYMMRTGFYPGIFVTGPMTIWGTVANRRPEFGELMPSWVKAPIDIFVAAYPDCAPAKALTNYILPDRFRDYLTILELTKRGYDGVDIYAKKKDGIWDEEEKEAWYSASRPISAFMAMESQFAVFRFNPKERREAFKLSQQIIEHITGLTPDQQDWIWRHQGVTGKQLSDYIGGLTPIQEEMLYTMSGLQKWVRVTVPLLPTEEQEQILRTERFWKEYELEREEIDKQIASFEEQFVKWLAGEPGGIDREFLDRERSALIEKQALMIETRQKMAEYKHIPITYEQRKEEAKKKGRQPTWHPIRELLWLYYELKPELVHDPIDGTYRDWDGYWRKTAAILDALSPEAREEFIANMQRNWTPLRKLDWWVNRKYVRSYRNARNVVMEIYTPEERRLLKEYIRPGTTSARREEIEQTVRADGRLLVSAFEADVRTYRINMRMLHPELDAWLNFEGIVRTFLTPAAEQHYNYIVQMVTKGDYESLYT